MPRGICLSHTERALVKALRGAVTYGRAIGRLADGTDYDVWIEVRPEGSGRVLYQPRREGAGVAIACAWSDPNHAEGRVRDAIDEIVARAPERVGDPRRGRRAA